MLLQRKSPLANKISYAKKFVVYGFFAALLSGLAMTTGIRDLVANDATSTTDDNPFAAKNTRTNSDPFGKPRKDDVNKKTNNPFQKRDSGKRKIGAFQSQKSKRNEEPEQTVNAAQHPKSNSNRSSIGNSSIGRPLELVQLATQYSNAIETISTTTFRLKNVMDINKRRNGTIPKLEIDSLKNLLRVAEQKKKLFYTIVKAELELTEHDTNLVHAHHRRLKKLVEHGAMTELERLKTDRELIRLDARQRILTAILNLK